MEKKIIVTVLFPALFMTIITIVSFSNMINFSDIDFKGIFIMSLILLFPLLFLLQGSICAVTNTNVFLSFGVSILDFIILMVIYLNDSAFIYLFIYLASGLIGYLITKFILKNKVSKK